MLKLIPKIILLLVITINTQLITQICQEWSGTVCIKCPSSYHLDQSRCLPDLVRIFRIYTPDSHIPEQTVNDTQPLSFIAVKKIENIQKPSIRLLNDSYNNQTDSNVNKLTHAIQDKITTLTLTKISAAQNTNRLQSDTSSSDLAKQSSLGQKNNRTTPQLLFQSFNLTRQIIMNQVNKISLQLFEYNKISNKESMLDPIAVQIISDIQYGHKTILKNSQLLAVYFNYVGFTKIYKIYFIDSSHPPVIDIFQSDSIVDLFHMQILNTGFALFTQINIDEGTPSSILNYTKKQG